MFKRSLRRPVSRIVRLDVDDGRKTQPELEHRQLEALLLTQVVCLLEDPPSAEEDNLPADNPHPTLNLQPEPSNSCSAATHPSQPLPALPPTVSEAVQGSDVAS